MATAEIARSTIAEDVMVKVRGFQDGGQLKLPSNYSPQNALQSAWLALQGVVDKEKRPVLQVCSRESIANSLLDMVIQGLSPAKKQCYFIAYGKTLTLQRSYMGTAAVAMRVLKSPRIPFARCIFEGDEFEYEITGESIRVTNHVQSLKNIDKTKIVGAYATVFTANGEPYTDVMTIDEIHQAWRQSPMAPFDEKGNLKASSTHSKFAIQMALKTAINRACKLAINTSDDSTLDLVIEAMHRQDDITDEEEFQAEVGANANMETIDAEWRENPENREEHVADEGAEDNKGQQPIEKKPASGKDRSASAQAAPKQIRRGPSF